MTIHDDWDALGMRASGSNSVSFDGVELPEPALRGGFPAGVAAPYMDTNLSAGLFHASASLGIAEQAQRIATAALAARPAAGLDGRGQTLVAESAIALVACRGALSRSATLVEDHHAREDGPKDPGRVTALFAEVQATKAFVNEAAVRVVDQALALSGGAGYRSGHPLARAYRDVRAGAFMHPLGANRAYDFVGSVALGREPSLH
jgi:alkylation response protein AidB-like acyl-CoA dehydrogenase